MVWEKLTIKMYRNMYRGKPIFPFGLRFQYGWTWLCRRLFLFKIFYFVHHTLFTLVLKILLKVFLIWVAELSSILFLVHPHLGLPWVLVPCCS